MRVVLEIDDEDLSQFVRTAADFGTHRFGYAVTPNADHIIRYHDDAAFRSAYADASFVLSDSRFVSNLLAATRSLRIPVCAGSDLTVQLFSRVIQPEDRVVLVGGSDEQAAMLRRRFRLDNLHHINPPMGFIDDPVAVDRVLEFVEQHSPFRFCLLAVGSPRQELLAQRLKKRGVARGLALCIGASVDFLTGREKRAPKLLQTLGFEWFYRLVQSPRRLAHRYLVRGPRVFWVLRRMDIRLRADSTPGFGPPRAPRPSV
jgi:exopolysaccharide biosynthesis WecB/TagA/CpsF family protein